MDQYYTNQAGTGIPGFVGVRYQRGHGFFSSLFTGGVLPILRKILPYLGKRGLETGMDIVDDVTKGEKVGASFKKRFKATGKRIGDDTLSKIQAMAGSGARRGRRRRRVRKAVMAMPVTFKRKRRNRSRRKGLKVRKRRMKRTRRSRRSKRSKSCDFL